jgi:hypothetical protein
LKESCNSALPFSLPLDVFYTSTHLDIHGRPTVRIGNLGGEYVGFCYADGARFAVHRNGDEILGDWPDEYSLEDAATYLVGPIMGFVLRLRGTIPLHASGIAVNDRAIALLGAPGAGKSTTAAAFAGQGYRILAEDVVALQEKDGSFWVLPGYPRVNLWPSSVEALFGSPDALPVVTPAWGKHFLNLDGEERQLFQQEPLPLCAIYFLGARAPGEQSPSIEMMDLPSALTTLVANTYVNYILDTEMRRQEFEVLGRMVSMLPVRVVRPSTELSRLPQLCRAITSDFQQLCAKGESKLHDRATAPLR